MPDEEIDFTDIPLTTPEMWAKGVVRRGLKNIPRKRQLTLRLDEEIVEFFKSGGEGYQTRINQLLRAYMEASKAAR